MSKFCGKCGAKLDERTGKCPDCEKQIVKSSLQLDYNLNIENQSNRKVENTDSLNKKLGKKETRVAKNARKMANKKGKKKKRIFLHLLAFLFCLVILISGIFGGLVYFNIFDIPDFTRIVEVFTKKTPEEIYAMEIVDAFKSKDMDRINNIIFSADNIKIDKNIGVDLNVPSKTEDNNEGVLNLIFSKTKLSYVGVENSKFIYNVEAPNMNEVFNSALDIQTQDELIKHISEYVQNAEPIKSKVAVEFLVNENKFIADYKTEEFVNAITGGLVDAYKNIYGQYMEDIISNGAMNYEKNN